MRILITNDDGYQAKGISVLAKIMKQFGEVTVIAPKKHQSGMSMAVSLGFKPIAHKDLGEGWHYIDATPASCIKFGLNVLFPDNFPDVVVSGINHGSNAATASCYSGTLGAAEEAALNGIPAIGVSLDTLHPDADFSAVEKYFGDIFTRLMNDYPSRHGIYYNVNFPDIPAAEIKGVRTGYQGMGRWVREFKEWDVQAYSKYGITPELLGQTSSPALNITRPSASNTVTVSDGRRLHERPAQQPGCRPPHNERGLYQHSCPQCGLHRLRRSGKAPQKRH